MSQQNHLIHYTLTRRLTAEEGEGWEFTCPECGYWARYLSSGRLEPELIVLSEGDPDARHTTSDWGWNLDAFGIEESAAYPPHLVEEEVDWPSAWDLENDVTAIPDEDWLTPELRRQIAAILTKMGL
jgi:hypothetical protein